MKHFLMNAEGEGGGASVPGQGASATVPSNTGGGTTTTTTQAAPDFSTFIPENYRGKPYLNGIDSTEKLFTAFDNAQKLIGQRPAGIPQENAAPEEWDKFYKAMGRPEKADAYEFEKVGTQERDAAFDLKVKEMFFKAGISAKQAKEIQTSFDNLMAEQLQNNKNQAEQLDRDFDKLALETFGERKDAAISGARELLNQFIPEKMKGHISQLSNENLIVMASVLDGVRSKYINEDGAPGVGKGGHSGEDMRQKARELMASEAYLNPLHRDHDSVKEQINQIYKSLR